MALFGTGRHRQDRRASGGGAARPGGPRASGPFQAAHHVGWRAPARGHRPALANRPPVLLADEPTGSLDDDSARSVLDLFADLQATSEVTVLAVSHDPRLNARADRSLVLAGGHLEPGGASS
ncbi:MAG: hypothetical protein R2746_04985 [Acidimicrobiales bacterium]